MTGLDGVVDCGREVAKTSTSLRRRVEERRERERKRERGTVFLGEPGVNADGGVFGNDAFGVVMISFPPLGYMSEGE